jgi:multisubunit Na+/H+ antiporter MnhE subunit
MQPGTGHGPAGGGGRGGVVRAFVTWWAALAAFWLALANKLDAAELVAALIAGAAGAAASVLARQQRALLPRPRPRWLLRLGIPLGRWPRDLWLLTRALALALRGRAPAGELVERPFDLTEGPRGAARRILAAVGGTLGPNTVVAGFDERRGTITVHQLLPANDPADAADPLRLARP